MATRARSGQAFMELAIGLFALALVLGALFGFSAVIVESLGMQQTLRAKAGKQALASGAAGGGYSSASDTIAVDVEPFAAKHIFGSGTIYINESVHMPNTKGL